MMREYTWIGNRESDVIKSLECGTEHVCWLTQGGTAGCTDGSAASREAELTDEMTQDVLEI